MMQRNESFVKQHVPATITKCGSWYMVFATQEARPDYRILGKGFKPHSAWKNAANLVKVRVEAGFYEEVVING